MANTTILDLPVVVTASGDEQIPCDTTNSSATTVTKRITAAQIAGLAAALNNTTGQLIVPFGGTGNSSFTPHALLLGNGTTAITQLNFGDNGFVLTSQGTGTNPVWMAGGGGPGGTASYQGLSVLGVTGTATANATGIIGSTSQVLRVNDAGSGLTFGQINLGTTAAVTGTLAVSLGGTGNSTLTSGFVLLGNGNSAINATAFLDVSQGGTGNNTLTANYVLLGNGTSPINATAYIAVSQGGTGTSSLTANNVLLGNGTSPINVTSVLPVSLGGTGTTTILAHSLMIGNGTGSVTILPTSSNNGWVLTSNGASSDPSWQASGGGPGSTASYQGLSVLGVTGHTTANATGIIGVSGQVLRVDDNGSSLVFGQVNLSNTASFTSSLGVVFGGTGTTTVLTTGSIIFAAANGSFTQNNASFSWNNTSGLLTATNAAHPGTLNVTGAVSFGSTLNVTGNVSVIGTLNATGAATFGSTVNVTGNVGVIGTFNATGAATFGSTLTTTGTLASKGALAITGTSIMTGNVGMGGTLNVTGAVTLVVPLAIASGGTNATTAAGAVTSLGALSASATGQTMTAGFLPVAFSLGTASGNTLTINCGNGPLQRVISNGTFTFAAPTSDGEADILVTNAASASTISISGFNVGSSTGDAYTTVNTNKFIFMARRINGSATYSWKAYQ